jgi:hypothetical protein
VVVGALIVLSILPSIGKLFLVADQADSEGLLSSSGSLLGQVVWSLMYVGAAIGLLSLRDRALPLLARSVPLIAFTLMTLVSTLWSAAPGISLRNSVEMIGTTVIAYYLVLRPVSVLEDVDHNVHGDCPDEHVSGPVRARTRPDVGQRRMGRFLC